MSKSSWRKSRFAAAGVLGFGLAACSDTTGPPAETAVGMYALQSINAQAVPFPLVSFLGYQAELSTGTLRLDQDNTFQERAIVTERVDGNVVRVDTSDFLGSWRQSGSAIRLLYIQPSDTIEATLKNGLLSYDVAQDTAVFHYVYKKQ